MCGVWLLCQSFFTVVLLSFLLYNSEVRRAVKNVI
jgi:hypothetical protein